MDGFEEVESLARLCDTASESMFSGLVRRLGGRAQSIAAVVQGEPLRFELSVAGTPLQRVRVTFTAHGGVVVVTDAALAGQVYRPDVVIDGTARAVLAYVLGHGDHPGAVVLRSPDHTTERLDGIIAIVADELLAMSRPD